MNDTPNPQTGGTAENRKQLDREKAKERKHHDKAVEDTFPASDPPATTNPGSGITGPNDPRERSNG